MFPASGSSDRQPQVTQRPPNIVARVLDAAVFWGLLVLIPVAVIPYGSADPWWEAVFECGVFVLAAIAAVEAFFMRRWQLRHGWVLLPLVLLTAFAFLQTVQWPPSWLMASKTHYLLTIDRYQTYLTARKMLGLTVFLTLLLSHLSTPRRLRWTIRAVLAVGIGSALFGIVRQFMQTTDAPAGFVLPFLFYGVGYGEFISPNPFAYLMELTLGLVAGVLLGGGAGRNRIFVYLAIIAVVWTALVLSNSRGGLMALGVEAIFVGFMSLRWFSERKSMAGERGSRLIVMLRESKAVQIAMIACVIIVLACGVFWMGGDQLAEKMGQTTADQNLTDGTTRQEIWGASWKMIKANPWTGSGFGAFFLGITQYQTSSGRLRLQQAHNDYLDLAANGGIVSVILAIWFVAAIWPVARRRLNSRDPQRRSAALGAATAIIGVAVHSTVDFGLQLTGIAVVFVAIIAILIADVRLETRRPHTSST